MTDDRAAHPTRPTKDSRVPPHNLDAEAALLGAALFSPSAAEIVVSSTTPADYYKGAHQHIAAAITLTITVGIPIDPVTIADELRRTGLLDEIGGIGYLLELSHSTPAASNASAYATLIRASGERRRLIATGAAITELGYSSNGTVTDAINRAAELVDKHATGTTTVSSWEVADIGALLATNLETEEPQLLRRSDGAALLYPGKMHVLQAEPSAGKSWIALFAVVEILNYGGSAIYLDFEDTPAGILRRLLTLGATEEQLRTRFDYRQIPGRIGAAERIELFARVDELNPDLVVIDGVAESLSREGLSEDSSAEFLQWTNLLPRPLARTGAAVLMLDHVIKDTENRGRWARGTGAKLGAIDGASYQLKIRTPFSRTRSGKIELVVAKDRPGGVGAINEIVASITVDPFDDGARVVISVDPQNLEQDRDDFKPTHLMGQIFQEVSSSAHPLTRSAVLMLIHSNKTARKQEALARLISEGYLAETTTRPKVLTVLRPYTAGTGHVRLAPAWREPDPGVLFDDSGDDTSDDSWIDQRYIEQMERDGNYFTA